MKWTQLGQSWGNIQWAWNEKQQTFLNISLKDKWDNIADHMQAEPSSVPTRIADSWIRAQSLWCTAGRWLEAAPICRTGIAYRKDSVHRTCQTIRNIEIADAHRNLRGSGEAWKRLAESSRVGSCSLQRSHQKHKGFWDECELSISSAMGIWNTFDRKMKKKLSLRALILLKKENRKMIDLVHRAEETGETQLYRRIWTSEGTSRIKWKAYYSLLVWDLYFLWRKGKPRQPPAPWSGKNYVLPTFNELSPKDKGAAGTYNTGNEAHFGVSARL